MSRKTNINNTSGGDNVSYSRKPYIRDNDQSYVETMKRVPRKAMMNQRLEKKSLFDKPYISDNYPEMEQYQPPPFVYIPDPDWQFPYFDGPVPLEADWPAPGTIIRFSIQNPHKCCCDLTENQNLLYFCQLGIVANVVPTWLGDSWKDHVEVYHNGARCELVKEKAGTYPLRANPAANNGKWNPGDLILLILRINGVVLYAQKKQIFCFDKLSCCDCDNLPNGAFAVDEDNTPNTISYQGTADIYVTGGCPPYTWSTASAGYTLDSYETNEGVNTVSHSSGTS